MGVEKRYPPRCPDCGALVVIEKTSWPYIKYEERMINKNGRPSKRVLVWYDQHDIEGVKIILKCNKGCGWEQESEEEDC